jgi:hypothetical protein
VALQRYAGDMTQAHGRQFAVWRCLTCACLWRDNLDGTISPLDAQQRSCNSCEAGPPHEACEIHWLNDDDGDVPASPRVDTFES